MPWANVGDLVFILDKKNNPVPAKIKEITDTDYIFEEIIDTIPIPLSSCPIKSVGYAGGKIFKKRDNAIDYLECVKEEGKFNMGNILNRKARRNQARQLGKIKDVNKLKEEITQESVEKVNTCIISAMLLAMNSECKIGSKRALKIVEKANQLIDTLKPDDIIQLAKDKKLR
jgi:hypothetical protein